VALGQAVTGFSARAGGADVVKDSLRR